MRGADLPIPSPPDVTAGGAAVLDALMRNVEKTVTLHFPDMLSWVKATLAVSAVRCLQDNRQPVALIAIGPPGVGKTQPLSFLAPESEEDELASIRQNEPGAETQGTLREDNLRSCLWRFH